MSHRRAKRARREGPVASPRPPGRAPTGRRRLTLAAGAALVGAALVVGVVVAQRSGPAAPALARSTGDTVDVSGTDPVTGQRVSLAQYAGRPVMLNVWGSWCEGCRAEARDLARFAHAHPEAQLVGIDLQDTEAGARDFYARYGWTHPSIFDPDGKIAFALGLQGTPTMFFLDRRHRLAATIVGATNEDGFERGLRAAKSG